MSDRLALLKAILAAPDDDLPRLVFADWLEENSTSDADAARAEFIRLGCHYRDDKQPENPVAKWLDRNWQRLLPSTLTADDVSARLITPCIWDSLMVKLDWAEAGRRKKTQINFRFRRGFCDLVSYTSSGGYHFFWQRVSADEPLALHRPSRVTAAKYDASSWRGLYHVLPTTWGQEIYDRVTGFDEERPNGGKCFRQGEYRYERDEVLLSTEEEFGRLRAQSAESRCLFAVATAMTARARVFVGLS